MLPLEQFIYEEEYNNGDCYIEHNDDIFSIQINYYGKEMFSVTVEMFDELILEQDITTIEKVELLLLENKKFIEYMVDSDTLNLPSIEVFEKIFQLSKGN